MKIGTQSHCDSGTASLKIEAKTQEIEHSYLDESSLECAPGAGGGCASPPLADELPDSVESQSIAATTAINGCSGSDRQVCRKLANPYLRHTKQRVEDEK